MKNIAESGFFMDVQDATVSYAIEDTYNSGTDDFGTKLGPCTVNNQYNSSQIRNGDLLLITVENEISFITPLLPQTLTFTVSGQRTVVASLNLEAVGVCRDGICQASETVASCPQDCLAVGDDPVVTIDYPANGQINLSGTETIMVTATDTEDDVSPGPGNLTVRVSIDGGFFQVMPANPAGTTTYTWDWDTLLEADGPHTVTVQAEDSDTQLSMIITYTVDVNNGGVVDNPPTISIVNPVNSATVSGFVTILLDATDAEDDVNLGPGNLTVDVQIGLAASQPAFWNGAYYEYAWDTTTNPAGGNGGITITATVTDSAAQTDSDVVSVTANNAGVPGSPPAISIVNPAPGPVGGTVTVQMNASDADDNVAPANGIADDNELLGTIEVWIPGLGWQDSGSATPITYDTGAPSDHTIYEYAFDTTALADGMYTLYARVTDSNGNLAYAPQVDITVNNAVAAVHVGSLLVTQTDSGVKWTATLEVLVHDAGESPVSGVLVNINWSLWNNSGGPVQASTTSCVTGGSGTCTVTLPVTGDWNANSIDEVRFTITALSAGGYVEDLGASHNPGTTISYICTHHSSC